MYLYTIIKFLHNYLLFIHNFISFYTQIYVFILNLYLKNIFWLKKFEVFYGKKSMDRDSP